MHDALTLDQIRIFLTVVDRGSFAAAARALGRAPSAVTYAVQKMEDQLGLGLFDRTTYRPALTEAGRTLLPRLRRIADEVGGLKLTAEGIAGGLEARITVVVDSMFPMERLLSPLRDFQERYASVQLNLIIETLGSAAKLVEDGSCTFGLMSVFVSQQFDLHSTPVHDISLVMVAAPNHPLAQVSGPIGPETLKQYVQLVLSDRSQMMGDRDHSVYSTQTWRTSDLGAKQAMLLTGLGYGSLPDHMVRDDIASGRLVPLNIAEGPAIRFPLAIVRRKDRPMGPATRWLIDRLSLPGDHG